MCSIATSYYRYNNRLTSRKVHIKKLSNLLRMTQSPRGRTETGSLVLDSKSHTHKFHTLKLSLPQAWKFEKSHASTSSTHFNSVTLESGSISRKVLQDSPNKINFVFIFQENIPKQASRRRSHPTEGVKRPHRVEDHTDLKTKRAPSGGS